MIMAGAQLLAQEKSFVLATVVTSDGSAPRGAGAWMIVQSNGDILGTIGGGILEARVRDLARWVKKTQRTVLQEYCLDGTNLAGMDMTCGGRVEVLLQYINGGESHWQDLFVAMLEARKKGIRSVLLTALPPQGEQEEELTFLWQENGEVVGPVVPGLQKTLQELSASSSVSVISDPQGVNWLARRIGASQRAFVAGGGHISCCLVPLLSQLGFYTIVVDDRAEFANRQRFPQADEVVVVEDYASAFSHWAPESADNIVIVTRGHLYDGDVLAQALGRKASYIGMIGSKKKRDGVYQQMLDRGFKQTDLHRVHSPIGLDIGAETVEEIAVSIAAEMIQIRARGAEQQ